MAPSRQRWMSRHQLPSTSFLPSDAHHPIRDLVFLRPRTCHLPPALSPASPSSPRCRPHSTRLPFRLSPLPRLAQASSKSSLAQRSSSIWCVLRPLLPSSPSVACSPSLRTRSHHIPPPREAFRPDPRISPSILFGSAPRACGLHSLPEPLAAATSRAAVLPRDLPPALIQQSSPVRGALKVHMRAFLVLVASV